MEYGPLKDDKALEHLEQIAVFEHLSPRQLQGLVPYCSQHHLGPGETVIEEGGDERQLFVVLEGEVGVFKSAGKDVTSEAEEHRIGTFGSGSVVGEMRFIDPTVPRSATVRTLRPTHLLAISYEAFEALSSDHVKTAYTFVLNLARLTSRSLRKTSEMTVSSLQRELDYAKSHAAMGRFISYIVILLFFYNLTLQLTIRWSKIAVYANVISFVIVAVFGLALFYMIRQSGTPLKEYGLTWKNGRQSVLEASAWTLGLLGLLTAIKWFVIQSVELETAIPLFGPFEFEATLGALATYAMYTLLAPVQEFIARGVMQSSFERFYSGKHRTALAIFVSNALFSAAHVHLSAAFAASVFLPGLLWGYLYARHRTLLGVSLSHVVVGLYTVYVLKVAKLMQQLLY